MCLILFCSPSARGALAHLFFWPDVMKANFLLLASTAFQNATGQ